MGGDRWRLTSERQPFNSCGHKVGAGRSQIGLFWLLLSAGSDIQRAILGAFSRFEQPADRKAIPYPWRPTYEVGAASFLEGDANVIATLTGLQRVSREWDANGRAPDWLAHTARRIENAKRLRFPALMSTATASPM